jgi:activating signal cointegrator complex subunit 1
MWQVYPFIIGKGGSSKKQIEQATGATLMIPRPHEGKAITIRASTQLAVAQARERTQLKIQTTIAGRLLDFTHFVSLPLNSSAVSIQVAAFKDQVGS